MKYSYFSAFACGFVFIGVTSGSAGVDTVTMGVGATVSRTCSVTTADLAFGALSVSGINASTATVSVVCNGIAPAPSVTLDVGGNTAGPGLRNMINTAGDFVPYILSITAGAAEIAADAGMTLTAGSPASTYSGTIYGAIAGSELYQIGGYTDSVVLTLTYAD